MSDATHEAPCPTCGTPAVVKYRYGVAVWVALAAPRLREGPPEPSNAERQVTILRTAAWAIWRTAEVGTEAWVVLGKALAQAEAAGAVSSALPEPTEPE